MSALWARTIVATGTWTAVSNALLSRARQRAFGHRFKGKDEICVLLLLLLCERSM